jgi:hypothetical protein
MAMTNDEALKWCRDHSVVVIFHRDQIVVAIPNHQIDAEAFRDSGFKLEMKRGFAMAITERGDQFHHVVEAAIASWKETISPADKIAEAIGKPTHIVKLRFRENML